MEYFSLTTFDAEDSLESRSDLHEILLVLHHLIDVFVSSRDLVDDVCVLTTFNSGCLHLEICDRELALRCST